MKKFTDDYFKKRYRILADRLLQKEGFLDDIKKHRKELKIPIDGFFNPSDLAQFLIEKMSKSEQRELTFYAFLESYANNKSICISDENREEVTKAFLKEGYNQGIGMVPMLFQLLKEIHSHHSLLTKHPLFEKNKYLSQLYKVISKIASKYWGVDLLDDHIFLHFIEKYLFLNYLGITEYIKSKTSCHNCKYLGVNHFSPQRNNMVGKNKGPYRKGYVFNKQTVQMLSFYFDSVFLIIKPYATKELILQYIDENWEDLKEHLIEKNAFYKQFDVHPSIIKESDDEKNRLIYELNKLSKKELFKRYNGKKNLNIKGIYKENIISSILEEEYGINMTSEAIKKSANRFGKSIKIQREPKDIGDI